MADEITKVEQKRQKLVDGLGQLAKSLRDVADQAEGLFSVFSENKTLAALDDGVDKKGRKRKASAVDESDEKPTRRKRPPRDPNAPKRPASSYIIFQNEIRKDLKNKNPTITNAELLTLIAKKWSEMSDADKEVYNKAVASAKEQYSNEKKAYDARSPEEVAAANAASEAAIAAKKALPRARKNQAIAPTPVAVTTPAPAATSPSDGSSEVSETDESDEEASTHIKKPVHVPVHVPQQADDSDESEEDEEEEEEEEIKPPPKKKGKTTALAPAPLSAPKGKKKTAK